MKLNELLNEEMSLRDAKQNIIDDIEDLDDYIGTVDMVPDWKKKITNKLLNDYIKRVNDIYEFEDEEETHEEDLVDERYEMVLNLITLYDLGKRTK